MYNANPFACINVSNHDSAVVPIESAGYMLGATSCAIFDNFDSPDQIAEIPAKDLLDLISTAGKI